MKKGCKIPAVRSALLKTGQFPSHREWGGWGQGWRSSKGSEHTKLRAVSHMAYPIQQLAPLPSALE